MVVEMMQPATPDLARRWLAALLLVPREDRETVVASIEAKINALYPMRGRELDLRNPPEQREGYVEQVTTTYAEVNVSVDSARRERAQGTS
jgi:hypothetical protein